jgi:hypothetical protein
VASGPSGSGRGPAPRAAVQVPLWLKAASLLSLLAFLALLVAAVKVGIGGDIALSNDLAVCALVSMSVFAAVNLSQQRSLARPTVSP